MTKASGVSESRESRSLGSLGVLGVSGVSGVSESQTVNCTIANESSSFNVYYSSNLSLSALVDKILQNILVVLFSIMTMSTIKTCIAPGQVVVSGIFIF